MATKHEYHFYEDGDLLIEARWTLFRIHEGEFVFQQVGRPSPNDMLELPGIGDRQGKLPNIKQVQLQDDPLVFASLLDAIYETRQIIQMDVKEQIQLALLAQKYGIDAIQFTCQSYLGNLLPNDISTRDFHRISCYEDDPSMAPLVIRVGELLYMPRVLPWAIYFFAIQSASSSSLLQEENILLRDSRASQLSAVRAINRQAIKYWNGAFARFMRGDCSTEWWVEEDECWRRCELFDTKKSSFRLDENEMNPLQAIRAAVDVWSPGLCSLCDDDLTRYANDMMAAVLGRIGRDVLQL